MAGRHRRRPAGHPVRRFVAVPGAEGRHDRVRVDSGGRAVDHAVSRIFPAVRLSPRHHPGKQHRADDGFGRRVDRVRGRRDDAGRDAAGLRDGTYPRDGRGRAGRRAGHLDDDSAAASLHRSPTRHAQVSRRHRLCRRADCGRRRRHERQDGVHRFRPGVRVPVRDAGLEALEGSAQPGMGLVQRCGAVARGQPHAAGRGLHHRHARLVHHAGRSGAVVSGPGPGHSFFRRRIECTAVPGHEADPGHDDRRGPPGVPAVHRRRGGRDGGHHQPVPRDPADRQLAGRRLARPAEQCHGRRCRPPHGSRPADQLCRAGHAGFDRRDLGRAAAGYGLERREFGRRGADRAVRLLVRHGILAADRRNRLFVPPG